MVPGAVLGPYEVVSLLGAGGMGEVYRARDTRLNRDVALKLLPETVAGDAERVARFQREAQVLASLNHPNIGAIFGLEEVASMPSARARPGSSSSSRTGSRSCAGSCRAAESTTRRVRHASYCSAALSKD